MDGSGLASKESTSHENGGPEQVERTSRAPIAASSDANRLGGVGNGRA